MAIQITLLDGDTGGKRSSLELLVGGVVGLPNGLAPGTIDGAPLAWDAGLASWTQRTSVVLAVINDNAAGGLAIHCDGEVDIRGLEVMLGGSDGNNGAVRARRTVGDAPQCGFFDTVPVSKPSVTGLTTQLQADSIVAALVALGLVTDNR